MYIVYPMEVAAVELQEDERRRLSEPKPSQIHQTLKYHQNIDNDPKSLQIHKL